MVKRSRRIDSTDDEYGPDFGDTETSHRRSTKTISYNEDDGDDATDVEVEEQANTDNPTIKEDEPDSDDPFAVPTSPEKMTTVRITLKNQRQRSVARAERKGNSVREDQEAD